MREKWKLSSDRGDWWQEIQMRLWRSLAESSFGGSLESGIRFCVGTFGVMKMFLYLTCFKHIFIFNSVL
jgi:hypothetical protein